MCAIIRTQHEEIFVRSSESILCGIPGSSPESVYNFPHRKGHVLYTFMNTFVYVRADVHFHFHVHVNLHIFVNVHVHGLCPIYHK